MDEKKFPAGTKEDKFTTDELIATVRRVSRELPGYREQTKLQLILAAAELERLAYPGRFDGTKT